ESHTPRHLGNAKARLRPVDGGGHAGLDRRPGETHGSARRAEIERYTEGTQAIEIATVSERACVTNPACFLLGSPSRIRTGTSFRTEDFKSSAYTFPPRGLTLPRLALRPTS